MREIRLFEAFSGIGAQHESLKQLLKEFPDAFKLTSVGVSEIDTHAHISYEAAHGKTKNYGDISKIDWSQVPDFDVFTMSSPCFVKGTLVQTERGILPIEEVQVGDKVLTHTNTYQKVLKVGMTQNAPTINLKGMSCGDITCTPNHPFYVREKYYKGHKQERTFREPKWVEAKDLTKSTHYLGMAINQKSELPKWDGIEMFRWKIKRNTLSEQFENRDFWYIMGRYVGDGWCRDSHTGNSIIICHSERNRESLVDALNRLGWNYRSIKERTVTKIFICGNELREFVRRYGYKAYGKVVDAETMSLPQNLLQGFIEGVIDSDGCYSEGVFKICSVSRELIYTLGQCVAKVYKCPVRMYFCARKKTTVIEGRTVNQRDTWQLVWHPDVRKQDHAFYEDGFVWFPLSKEITLGETADVYNMEVETDNSYTANGAIVHNCQDFSQAGHQKGGEEGSGTRSSLLWECRRAIIAKKPKYVIFENVPALVSKKFIDGFIKWVDELNSYGYNNFWQLLNAKNYGTAQNRERVFMVSILRTEDDPDPQYKFPNPIPLTKCVEDYMDDDTDVDEEYFIDQDRITRKVVMDILEGQKNVREEIIRLYEEKRRSQDPD